MPNKTFHIPDNDKPLWAAAQRVATRRRTSLYRIVAEALTHDLSRAAEVPADPYAHIAADAA